MQPIWSLIKSTQNDSEWNPTLKSGLTSTLAGRQFPQVRCFAAGWAVHSKRLACLHDIVAKDESEQQRASRDRKKDDLVQAAATAAQIAEAPVGDLFHRAWSCKRLDPTRDKFASGEDRARAREGWGRGKAAWERALIPLPPPPPRPPAEEATFHWKVRPGEDFISATFYVYGSALNGPCGELMRCGWSFVAVDGDGNALASAYGATPP